MIEQTSLTAFEEIKPKISARHQIILNALKDLNNKGEDATDYELAVYLGYSDPNFVRPRRYELVNKFKLVGLSEKRICSISGKMALAWKVLRISFN